MANCFAEIPETAKLYPFYKTLIEVAGPEPVTLGCFSQLTYDVQLYKINEALKDAFAAVAPQP